MNKAAILELVREETHKVYLNASHPLPFHGWHHIEFVRRNALRFCEDLGADPFLVEVAAYVHDLNYVVDAKSHVEAGEDLRQQILSHAGLDQENITRIEQLIQEESIHARGSDISPEAKALSDGDTLFKIIPITPVLFTSFFLDERQTTLEKLANRVVDVQKPLIEKDIYFYSKTAQQYMKWAKTNLDIWENITEYLKDENVAFGTTGIEKIDRYL